MRCYFWTPRGTQHLRALVPTGVSLRSGSDAALLLPLPVSPDPGDDKPDPTAPVRPLAGLADRRGGWAYGTVTLDRRGPLRSSPLEPDPMTPIARAMADLRDGEVVEVAFDFRAIPPSELDETEKLRQPGVLRDFGSAMARVVAGQPGPGKYSLSPVAGILDPFWAAGGKAAPAPRKPQEELVLSAQVLVRARSSSSAEAWGLVVRTVFEPLAQLSTGASRMRLHDRSERWFRPRWDGLFAPKAPGFTATAPELAGLLVPPTVRCDATNVVRAGGTTPDAPPGLPDYDIENPDLVIVGRVETPQGSRIKGWERDNALFLYDACTTGGGKTTRMVGRLLHVVRHGLPAVYMDPDRDAVEYAMGWLPKILELAPLPPTALPPLELESPDPLEALEAELATTLGRVVEINLNPHRGEVRVPGWNPFDVRHADEIDDVVGDVRDAFVAALGWKSTVNSRAITLTENVVRTLCEIALLLPLHDRPTIFQTISLLTNKAWRSILVGHLTRPMRDYWRHEFPGLKEDAKGPVLQMAQRLRQSGGTLALFGQSRSAYRIGDLIDDGKVVLICPRAAGKEATVMLTTLFVSDIVRAARARENRPVEERGEAWFFGDEALDLPAALVQEMLNHARKDGWRMCLANQDPQHLNRDLFRAIMTNGSYRAAGGMSADGAALFVREWQNRVEAGAITGEGTRLHDFIVSVRRDTVWTAPFRATTVPVEELWGPPDPDGARKIRASSTGFATPAEVRASLEDLEDRIALHLRNLGRAPDDGEEEDGGWRK